MSLLSQFFGGSAGISTQIESKILIVDGGKGYTTTGTWNTAGSGGSVYELNVYLTPGAVCPITVGYGGTSLARTVCMFCTSPYGAFCPAGSFTAGNYGELSAFSNLVGSCRGPACGCTPVAPAPCSPCSPPATWRCYAPVANATAFYSQIPLNDREKQSVPGCTFDLQPKTGLLEEYSTCGPPGPAGPAAGCNLYKFGCGGFYDTFSSLGAYGAFKNAVTNSTICFTNPSTCSGPNCFIMDAGTVQSNFAQGVGYVSDITGCVCVYGAGGIQNYCATPTPYTAGSCGPAVIMCRCDVTYTGSGAGAPSAPGSPTVPTRHGCPGIVVVQYPTNYAAATTSSPTVCDCSPLTPGYRTYKFYCPGSITLP